MLTLTHQSLRWIATLPLAAILLGCASTESARRGPTPQQDFQEYRELVVSGISQVDAALDALDNLSAHANGNARPAYNAFCKAVQRLQVDSIRVREHTQAMRARGDAYFEHWEKWLSGANDQGVRSRAAEHHDELKRSFQAVQAAAQKVREDFRPFLTDLEKICAVLDQGPTLARIDAQKELILSAAERGERVEQNMERILAETNTMLALLRTPGHAASH